MFSRIFGQMKEPFLSADQLNKKGTIPQDPLAAGTKMIQNYYANTMPNAVYSKDPSMPLSDMTRTADPLLTGTDPVLKDEWVLAGLSGDLLSRRQAECEAAGSGDQFDHLNSLANGYDKKSRARCGWIYNNSKPSDGRGAFGTIDGAFNSTVAGTWTWNLEKAREKYHTAICKEVKNCEDLDAPMYKGRCGWCSKSGKAVPIASGQVAYPYGPLTACPGASLVTSSGSCPKPPPPVPGVTPSPANQRSPAQACDPLPNGNLPRDCLILKARQAGCSDSGTMIDAMKRGSDMNYFDSLSQAASYILYQQRASVGLDDTALSKGKITIGQALTEFKRVNDQAASNLEGGIQFAARDLCYKSGTMATFDFCTEILDSTLGPFSLECLQKEFLRMGGQKTGTMFPGPSNLSTWNSQNKWMDVKRTIGKIAEGVRSTDRAIQEEAMIQFYGIPLEDKKKPAFGAVSGVELFWFSHNPANIMAGTIFLGRRIRNKLPLINNGNDLKGAANTSNVSMVFYANLNTGSDKTVRVRVTSDDGFAVHLNKQLGTGYRQGLYLNDANNLTALDNFPATTFVASAPWMLTGDGPNILRGYWFQGGGSGLFFKMEMQDFTAGSPGIPPDCKCLGFAQNGMRYYSSQDCSEVGGIDNPKGGNWYGNGECLIGHNIGGSYTAGCAALNNLSGKCVEAKSGPWQEVPQNILNLTQEPYAPMISFQVHRAPQDFGGDFSFADKRMGSFKMKWATLAGTPLWVYRHEQGKVHPLGLPIVRFRTDTSIRMVGSLKMFSFMTMTVLLTFNAIPNSANMTEHLYFFGDLGRISIKMKGIGGNQGQLYLYAEGGGGAPQSRPVPLAIKANTAYLLILRSVRDKEDDIYSVSGITLDAQEFSVLKKNTSNIPSSNKMSFPNPRLFSDPDTTESRSIAVGASDMDLTFIRFYDYDLDEDGLAREAKNDWQRLGEN
jgi:hypothetical protein